MKKYNVFQAIVLSFFSKELYQDVAKNWRGFAFSYLLLVLAIFWLPATFQMYFYMHNFVTKTTPQIVQQLPTITLKDGQASIDKPSPYFIRTPDNHILAVIDTSGQFTSPDQTQGVVLLTKDKLYIKRNATEVRQYELKNTEDMVITQTKVYNFLHLVKNWGLFIVYPILVIGSWIYRVIETLIYAIIGTLIFANIMKVKLEYQQILRIAVMAVTPPIVLSTVLDFFFITFPYQFFLYFIIAMAYIVYGINANRKATSPEEIAVTAETVIDQTKESPPTNEQNR